MVSGKIEVAVAPLVGDLIALKTGGSFNVIVGEERRPFNGQLRVTDRIIQADEDSAVLLALEDITAATTDEAERLLKMLEQQHGLFADLWEV